MAVLKTDEQRLRYLLWMFHGHGFSLIGNNGEMGCTKCGFDFGKLEAAEIQDRLLKIKSEEASAVYDHEFVVHGQGVDAGFTTLEEAADLKGKLLGETAVYKRI